MSHTYRSKHGRRALLRGSQVPATANRPELEPVRPFLPPLAHQTASPARPTDLYVGAAATVTLPRVHATAILPALRAETDTAPAPVVHEHVFSTHAYDRAWRRNLDAAHEGYRSLAAELDERAQSLLADANETDAELFGHWYAIETAAAAKEDLGPWPWAQAQMDVVDARIAATAAQCKRGRRDALNSEYSRTISTDHAVLDSVEAAVKRLALEVELAFERATSPRRVAPPTDTFPRLTPELLAELDAAHGRVAS